MVGAIETVDKDCFSLESSCALPLEAIDKPTARRARRAVRPIHGQHGYHVALGGSPFFHNLNKRTARQIRLDNMQGQRAKPESCADEGMLGAEIGEQPRLR
jgi:hypothetical protein